MRERKREEMRSRMRKFRAVHYIASIATAGY